MSPPMATRHVGTVRHAERELRRASLHLLLSAGPLFPRLAVCIVASGVRFFGPLGGGGWP